MTKTFYRAFRHFLQEEDAPTLAEYGILVALIAVVGAVGVTDFGGAVKNLFEQISDMMP